MFHCWHPTSFRFVHLILHRPLRSRAFLVWNSNMRFCGSRDDSMSALRTFLDTVHVFLSVGRRKRRETLLPLLRPLHDPPGHHERRDDVQELRPGPSKGVEDSVVPRPRQGVLAVRRESVFRHTLGFWDTFMAKTINGAAGGFGRTRSVFFDLYGVKYARKTTLCVGGEGFS